MIWLQKYFIWFVLYSIMGWVWEEIICSINARKLVNRGFLNGPYCPIYGSGALLVIVLLGWIENPIVLFAAGAVLTCALEYMTSWAMEKLFHARWWDYSKNRFNLHGRVCLRGAVAFGALSVLLLKFIHPSVVSYTMRLSDTVLSVLSDVLFVVMLADTVYTVKRIWKLDEKLKELTEKANQAKDAAAEQRKAMREKLQESTVYEKLTAPYAQLLERINAQERRVIKAFPKLRSTRYDEILQRIKQAIAGKGDHEELP